MPDKHTALMKRFGQNYVSYRETLLSRDKEYLIEKAREIATMQEAYSYLTTRFEFDEGMVDNLLMLDNPLKYLADRWLVPVSGIFDVDWDIRDHIKAVRDSQEYLCQKAEPASLRVRLQRAAQEVKERPAPEKPARDTGVR